MAEFLHLQTDSHAQTAHRSTGVERTIQSLRSPVPTNSRVARVVRIITVVVGIQSVAAMTIAIFAFDGPHFLLAGFAGCSVMAFVSLPALLAAIGDMLEHDERAPHAAAAHLHSTRPAQVLYRPNS